MKQSGRCVCMCICACSWSVCKSRRSPYRRERCYVCTTLSFLQLKSRPTGHIVVSTKRESPQQQITGQKTPLSWFAGRPPSAAQGLDLIARNDANNKIGISPPMKCLPLYPSVGEFQYLLKKFTRWHRMVDMNLFVKASSTFFAFYIVKFEYKHIFL